MRMTLAAAIAVALAGPAAAQQFMDGSERSIPQPTLDKAVEMIGGELSDPYSAQYRKLKATEDMPQRICGEVNSRNRLGGYTGFRVFIAKTDEDAPVLAPEQSAADPDKDAALIIEVCGKP